MNSILHIGNISGVPQELSRAQRELGFKSDILSFDQNKFNYETDFYCQHKLPFPLFYGENAFHLLKFLSKYDILHFHYSSIFPNGIDIPIWKMFGKKVIVHHHGSDIRYSGEQLGYSKFSNRILVSTPDLLEWSPNAIWIPNPINLEKLSYVGVKSDPDVVNIVHAPSNRAKKGTDHVIRAVKKLQNEGYKINLSLIENMSHNEAIIHYQKADIVVDQLLIGWYGMTSIECMAFGKPTCVYIRDDLESYMPFNPIINTSPENIIENLRLLIEDESLRKKLGENGRKYVNEIHDSKKIAKKVLYQYFDDSKICSFGKKRGIKKHKKTETMLFPPLFGSTRENPVLNNMIYVCFGQQKWGDFFSTNYTYNPITDIWTEGIPGIHSRDGVACAVCNNKLYVFGGRNAFPPKEGLNYVEEYDPNAEAINIYPWQNKAAQPSPLADSSAATYDGIIYVFGGYHPTGDFPKDSVYAYNPVKDSWSIKATMPTARWGHIAVASEGKIYVFGGQTQYGCTNILEIYDPIDDSWSIGAPMPYAAQGLMGVFCQFDRQVHLFGGYDGCSFRNDYYTYDAINDIYNLHKMNLPTARNWATAAVVSDHIFIIGGYSAMGPTNIIEVYNLTSDSWS